MEKWSCKAFRGLVRAVQYFVGCVPEKLSRKTGISGFAFRSESGKAVYQQKMSVPFQDHSLNPSFFITSDHGPRPSAPPSPLTHPPLTPHHPAHLLLTPHLHPQHPRRPHHAPNRLNQPPIRHHSQNPPLLPLPPPARTSRRPRPHPILLPPATVSNPRSPSPATRIRTSEFFGFVATYATVPSGSITKSSPAVPRTSTSGGPPGRKRGVRHVDGDPHEHPRFAARGVHGPAVVLDPVHARPRGVGSRLGEQVESAGAAASSAAAKATRYSDAV